MCCQKELRGSSDNGPGLLTWGPCLWFQRHRDRQLLQACLCICKYPYTPSEPWEQSGHLPQIQCMSHPYNSVTDGAGIPTGHCCPGLKHADHPRAAVLSLWDFPILWLRKIERTIQMKCCPIIPLFLTGRENAKALLTRQGWKRSDNGTSIPPPFSFKAVLEIPPITLSLRSKSSAHWESSLLQISETKVNSWAESPINSIVPRPALPSPPTPGFAASALLSFPGFSALLPRLHRVTEAKAKKDFMWFSSSCKPQGQNVTKL